MHGRIQHPKVEPPSNKSWEKHELDLSWLLPIQGEAEPAVSNVAVQLQITLH